MTRLVELLWVIAANNRRNKMKIGTIVMVGNNKPELATVIQPNQYTKPPNKEWHIVRMHSDGAKLSVHQSRLSIA
jgi:hypothetical protein